jgi:glutathione S-transferase
MTRIADPDTVGIPPNLWPPALELPNGKWLSQTGVVVSYLSPKLGLAGYAKDDVNLDEDEKAFLSAKSSQLFFTALDMIVEVSVVYLRGPIDGLFIRPYSQIHNVHHPVSINFYYEDQKTEALRAAEQFRASRLPKFLQHFQSVLETNSANKDGNGNVLYFNATLEMINNIVGTNKVLSYFQTSPQPRIWRCSII